MEEFSKMIRDEFQTKDTEIDEKLMYGLKQLDARLVQLKKDTDVDTFIR